MLRTIALSLGVASFPLHEVSGESLFRAADAAPYCAKQNNRTRTEVAAAG